MWRGSALKAQDMAKWARLSSTSNKKQLLDSFGRNHNYLRMSLTERCNLRCVYCMPSEGVPLTPSSKLPTLQERRLLLSTFVDKFGVDKLRFTGGEPTISPDLLPLIKHARDNGVKSIGITSNGVVLERHLEALVSAGLTHVNISLDTLKKDKFAKLSRRDGSVLNRVLSSIRAALRHDLHVKVNVVLMRGVNDDELADFVHMTRNFDETRSGDEGSFTGKYHHHDSHGKGTKNSPDVRFIEMMPFNGNAWEQGKLMSYGEALQTLRFGHGLLLEPSPSPTSSGSGRSSRTSSSSSGSSREAVQTGTESGADPHDTTKWYTVDGGRPEEEEDDEEEGGGGGGMMIRHGRRQSEGRVGFITTMSNPFCAGCNRVRITADLRMKSCLFGSDVDEQDLLPAVRRALGVGSKCIEGGADADAEMETERCLHEVEEAIASTVQKKHYRLGGHGDAQGLVDNEANNRPMITIGG